MSPTSNATWLIPTRRAGCIQAACHDGRGAEPMATVASAAALERQYVSEPVERAARDRPSGFGRSEGGAISWLPAADNVRVERFVPHGPVLERAAAVICHGGMGIVQKAIGAKVPIVAVPFGRDQPEVGRRIAESGTGVLVKNKDLSAQRLRSAVREARSL